MFRFSLKISVSIISFFLGIIVFAIWNFTNTQIPQIQVNEEYLIAAHYAPVQTNVCELIDNPEKYDGKVIRFKATIYSISGNESVLLGLDCYCKTGNIWFPKINLANYRSKNELNVLSENFDRIFEVDIEILGVARKVINNSGYLEYSIEPITVVIISPFREFESRGAA